MSISRRQFIGGGVTLAAMGALAGCSNPGSNNSKSQDSSASNSLKPADETLEYDVVVLGSGTAGLSAAIEAAEAGAKVVLLEKESNIGGNSAVSEGIFGVGSKMQKSMGINDTADEILKTEYEFQNYNVNPKLWEVIARDSGGNIDWLVDHGVKFGDVRNPGIGPKVWHVFEGLHGQESIDNLAETLKAAGGEIRTSCPGTAILMDGDKVIGVRAEEGKKAIDFKAKGGVCLCTGGMAADPEKVIEHTNAEQGKFAYLGMPGPTGDAIRLALDAGMGKVGQITMCNIGLNVEGLGFFNQFGVCMGMEPTNVWVNEDGERFAPESNVFKMTTAGNNVLSQHKVFSIMDQKSFDRIMTSGPILGQETETVAGVPCKNLKKNVDDALAHGNPNVFTANTLDELAEKLGVDAATLKGTIDKYNANCAEGTDKDYYKTPEYLVSLDTPPYYAARLATNNLSTFGGVRVNKNFEVTKAGSGDVIPGLYAGGIDCSGFQGETYGIVIAGSTQGVAVGGGRIAGRNAAARAKNA